MSSRARFLGTDVEEDRSVRGTLSGPYQRKFTVSPTPVVAGDWNDDGKFSPALYRPSNMTMYFRYTNTQGNADAEFVPMPKGAAWLPISGTR